MPAITIARAPPVRRLTLMPRRRRAARCRLDRDGPSIGHRVACVHYEVDDHLLELPTIRATAPLDLQRDGWAVQGQSASMWTWRTLGVLYAAKDVEPQLGPALQLVVFNSKLVLAST